MKMWTLLNEENRIVMVTREKQNDEQFEFDFPSDFAFGDIINWKIVNGKLVNDEILIPIEPKQQTIEERLAEMQEAIDFLLMQ